MERERGIQVEVEVGVVSGCYSWGVEAVGRACLFSTSSVNEYKV